MTLIYWKTTCGDSTVKRWLFHSKRVPIRKCCFCAEYHLHRNSNSYDILFFAKPTIVTYETAVLWLLEGITVGFTFFPSFAAQIHKNPLYIECTRYSCNKLLIYVQVLQMARKTIQPWFPMLHQAPPPPRCTNISCIWLMWLLTMHEHRMGTWNVPIRPLLTKIWGGTVVGFWVVWGLGDIGHAFS